MRTNPALLQVVLNHSVAEPPQGGLCAISTEVCRAECENQWREA